MPGFRPLRRPRRRGSWLGLVLALLAGYLLYQTLVASPRGSTLAPDPIAPRDADADDESPSCPDLPGLEQVLVVMKTGVTEARDKVPVHLETTLRCVPHYVLFSDFDEEIAGVRIHDVLHSISPDLQASLPEFDLYHRVRAAGRPALTSSDLNPDVNTNFGKPNNPGWKLDKWKFLPMLNETRAARPDAQWFVFMEADTYVVWPNLLAWLAQYDARQPWYLGNQMQIGDVLFGHGGSGFVLSRPALHRAVEHWEASLPDWDRYTRENWAGDCVLGKLLHDVGVDLRWSWPMLQRESLAEFDYFSEGYFKRPWCYPPVAFHHLQPRDVQTLWEFDRRWFRAGNTMLLFRDVWEYLVKPQVRGIRSDWDNHVGDDRSGQTSISMVECRSQCVREPDCVQYGYDLGKCWTASVPKLGVSTPGLTSGWMADRIERLTKEMGACHRVSWI